MNVILTIVFVIVGIIGIRYGYQYGYQFAKNRNVPKPYVLTEYNGRKIGVVLEFTPSRHQGLQFVNYVVFREDPQREFMGFRNEDVLKNITYSRKIRGKVDSRIVGLGEKKETVISDPGGDDLCDTFKELLNAEKMIQDYIKTNRPPGWSENWPY